MGCSKSRSRRARILAASSWVLAVGCDEPEPEPPSRATTSAAPATASAGPRATPSARPSHPPDRIEIVDEAMGTEIHLVTYTTEKLDRRAIEKAMGAAMKEIVRLEALLSGWRDDSDVGRINRHPGAPVTVSAETMEVFQKGRWVSELSDGAFDVSFNAMGDLWKFGDAAEDPPSLPDPAEIATRRAHIDYREVQLDPEASTVTIGRHQRVGLGGVAKGYVVDRARAVLAERGLSSFLLQAGGDLYGAGRKPDGSPWVSGIRDPRGPRDAYFAIIELEDHAFSTAGDYARAFVLGKKRYHHIIDPKTGYPATASRSVTIWAPDAFVADAIDDAVFILGPEKGLALVESLPGVGAVVVDGENNVHLSERVKGKVRILREPTPGI